MTCTPNTTAMTVAMVLSTLTPRRNHDRADKTECVRPGSPFRTGPVRTLADLENMTSAWVSWYNTARLMHRLGRIPPGEAEAKYYARLQAGKHVTRCA